MIVDVDVEELAEFARTEAARHEIRTPERRAAAALWVALVTSTTLDGARKALATFAHPQVVDDALELLGRLAAPTQQTKREDKAR